MSNNQQQMTLRTANDNEHAEISKQLMGVAKKPAVTMGYVFIFIAVTTIAALILQSTQGANSKKTAFDIFMTFLCLIWIFVAFGFFYIFPYYQLCKRKYYIADCIVTNVRSSSDGKGGRNYYATVTFTDRTSIVPVEDEVHAQTEVPVQTSEIFRKAAPGAQAVVVYITQKIPIPYSLCIL